MTAGMKFRSGCDCRSLKLFRHAGLGGEVSSAKLESFYRQSGQPEHSVEISVSLACLPPEHFSNIQLKKTTSKESPYDIIDGVHRAALLWHAGFDGIPVTMISMTDSKVFPRLLHGQDIVISLGVPEAKTFQTDGRPEGPV